MAIKQTTVHHIAGKRFLGETPDSQRVVIDGETHAKAGMNPMELVLNAVGACAAFDIVEMLKKRKLDIVAYRVELEGERFDGTPAYYTKIHNKHIFNVPGLNAKTADRFVDLAVNKYCSVGSSLKAEMTYEVILEHEESRSE